MSDPAVEAVRRAWAQLWPDQTNGEFEFALRHHAPWARVTAREALAPIRELHRPIRHPKFADWSDSDFATLPDYLQRPVCAECIHHVSGTNTNWPCATAYFVYPSEEL